MHRLAECHCAVIAVDDLYGSVRLSHIVVPLAVDFLPAGSEASTIIERLFADGSCDTLYQKSVDGHDRILSLTMTRYDDAGLRALGICRSIKALDRSVANPLNHYRHTYRTINA